MLRVRDGRIARNDAYMNGAELARQLGALPPQGSATEERMATAFNLTTRVKRRLSTGPEPVADGVWVVRGGFPKTMNVYLLRDGDGVMLFDAGIKAMTGAVAAAGASLGGITRVVLGHGHPDHRGVAPVPRRAGVVPRRQPRGRRGRRRHALLRLLQAQAVRQAGLPLPAEDVGRRARGDRRHGGRGRRDRRLRGRGPARPRPGAHRTVARGRPPGAGQRLLLHARSADRRSTATRAFHITRSTATPSRRAPRSASSRRMEPAAAWAGHAEPLTGDVRAQLETAAATT